MVTSSENDSTVIHKLNLARMRENRLLPPAISHEILRTRSTGSSIRSVRQDFLLADRYLLKKGSTLQMPSFPTHPRKRKPMGQGRKGVTTLDALSKRDKPPSSHVHSAALEVGTTLCPGRPFRRGGNPRP